MTSFEKHIFKQYKKSLMYKIICVYIIFGLFIFSIDRGEYAYFELLQYSTNHPFFIALFLIPGIMFSVIFIETKYYNNYSILLRIGNKRNVIISNFKLIIWTISDLFIVLIASSLILTNLFANRNYYIANDKYYHIPNLLILLVSLVKNYIFGLIVGLIGSYLSNKKIYLNIIITLLIIISFMGIIPSKFLFLFPGYYISNYHIFSSFIKSILFSLIYLSISFVICFSLYRKKWRSDII